MYLEDLGEADYASQVPAFPAELTHHRVTNQENANPNSSKK